MIIGVDIDGVLTKSILRLTNLVRYKRDWWSIFVSTPIGRFVYKKLPRINKEMKNLLIRIRKAGHRIVIISYMAERNRETVEDWLRKNGIPFDKLVLPQEGEKNLFKFKARAIREEGCDHFIDDDPEIVETISLLVPGVVIQYFPGSENSLASLLGIRD